MPELRFQVEGADPDRFAAEPLLIFKLRVSEQQTEGEGPVPIHGAAIRCQIRIEPSRRRYSGSEQKRLLDLFGTPERWGQTVRPMLWTHVGTSLPPFSDECVVNLPVPCSSDFNLAATKYFAALDDGEVPLCFLFSGTIFHADDAGALRVAQISWDREAIYRLPAESWRGLMQQFYANTAWLTLRKDVFDRLALYRSHLGLLSWEQTLERLLSKAEAPASP
jgi:hypothetical protein